MTTPDQQRRARLLAAMEIEQWVLRGGNAASEPPAMLAAADAAIAAEQAKEAAVLPAPQPGLGESAAVAVPSQADGAAAAPPADAPAADQPLAVSPRSPALQAGPPGASADMPAGSAEMSIDPRAAVTTRAAADAGNADGPPDFWDDIPDEADYGPPDDDATPPITAAPEDPIARRRREIAAMDWDALQRHASGCDACSLCETRKNVVFGVGTRNARLLVIGEAPGADEDASGEPFVGQAGKLLDAMLAAIGLDRRSDVYIANVLKCRPPRNRDPLPEEMHACSMYLSRQAELLAPDLVLLVGRFAAQTMLATDTPVGRLRGHLHHVDLGGRRVPAVVSYHPAYLLRSPAEKAKSWADLCMALDLLNSAREAASR